MGRHAKSTRGGNKHRLNPGRLAKKFAKQGMSERSAAVAARTAAKLSKQQIPTPASSTTDGNNTSSAAASSSNNAQQQQQNNNDNNTQQQQLQFTSKKNAIAHALAQLKQQRTIQEDRTVVKQAQRRR